MNLDQLLESERARPGFSGRERATMWSGIQRSIGAAGVAAAAGATAAAASSSAASHATSHAVGGAAKLAKWKLAGLLSAVALAGAGAGAGAHARFATPKVVEVERAAQPASAVSVVAPPQTASPEPVPPTATALATAASSASAPSPAQPKAARAAAPSAQTAAPAKDPSLARERTLLDMARTALSRGDASGALASLDTHAREFPRSQLAPEREVLAIQALASTGRMPEARKRAAAFRTHFANSPLLPIVDEATQ